MKTLTTLLATLTLAATSVFLAVPVASAAVTVPGCPGSYDQVINVNPRVVQTYNVDNTAIVGTQQDNLTVNGSNDCVLGGVRAILSVNGNNNFVTGKQAQINVTGSGDTIVSQGHSIIDGGGNVCIVNNTDITTDCN